MRGGFHWTISWRFTKLDFHCAVGKIKGLFMTEGQVIRPQDKKCPKCGKKYKRIASRDAFGAELQCECGKYWTVYYERRKQ